MNPLSDPIAIAVKAVQKLYKENDWHFSYCVGKIAEWHRIEYRTLMAACGKRSPNPRPKPIPRSRHAIPDSAWWIK